jgi:amino acid adenylation domain-containing protein
MFTGPVRPLPDGAGWWAPFLDVVARHPDRTALVTDDESWTFAELDRASDRLCGILQDHGAGAGDLIACAMRRTAAAVVTVLAVAKTGGIYLPLDVAHPRDRLADIVSDAAPRLLITDVPGLPDVPGAERFAIQPGHWSREPSGLARPACRVPAQPDEPAYVIYTSGSSGRPKGVVVSNRSLSNLYGELQTRFFGLSGRDVARVAHGMSMAFDAAWNPLLWMIGGHELHLLADDVRSDPERYVQAVRQRGLCVVEVVPALAGAMIEAGLLEAGTRPDLLLMGGEAISATLWSRVRAVTELVAVNLYGPTECTVFAASCDLAEHASPVIGRPIGNAQAKVVGTDGQEAADGESGELWIGGDCVAIGYLNQPELTAERFVTDPGRWYRTGDLCRAEPGGFLTFLGRLDDQVKIRGHRVEPAEAERALLACPQVRQAVVTGYGPDGDRQLVAYVVPAAGEVTGGLAATLGATLRARLPEHLVPSVFVQLESMPLNSNGKIDRSALPPPTAGNRRLGPITAARSEAEKVVAKIWCGVLDLTEADVYDDFFDLGGNSLRAARLVARLRAAGVPCELRDVMRMPTIAALAALVPTGVKGD